MPKNNAGHKCSYCEETYRKQDFDVCPHCAGNGGSRTNKTWMPSKKKQKEYAKKNKHLLN